MQIAEKSNSSEQSEESAATPTSVVRGATGPRTQRGKQNSKRNALKHGIFSKVVLLMGEPQAELDALLRGLQNDLRPEGTLEELLVDKLVALLWRHRRLMNVIVEGERPKKGIEALVGTDFSEVVPTPLDLAVRYESTLERAFDRALNQLERLQRIRMGQALPPTLNVNVST
jgi:hypothetical protein